MLTVHHVRLSALRVSLRAAGNWSEKLLESMYFVTAQHGAVFPHEIESLWSTVAGNKRNVIPILDYVISKGLAECGQVQSTLFPYYCHEQGVSCLQPHQPISVSAGTKGIVIMFCTASKPLLCQQRFSPSEALLCMVRICARASGESEDRA